MKKEELIEIIASCFNENDVRNDFDVLIPIVNNNDVTPDDLRIYLKSISKNIAFFRKELNYPLQLSNLLLFELDARKIKSNNGRGSSYRYDLIESYKKMVH